MGYSVDATQHAANTNAVDQVCLKIHYACWLCKTRTYTCIVDSGAQVCHNGEKMFDTGDACTSPQAQRICPLTTTRPSQTQAITSFLKVIELGGDDETLCMRKHH